jgi:hypothetical protein
VTAAGARLMRKMPFVRRLFHRIILLESFVEQFRTQIVEKNDRISALEALLATAQQEIAFRRAPLGNDIEAIESVLAEYSPETLARFFAHRSDLPSTLMIGVPAERLSAALAYAGFTVERSPTPPEDVVDGCGIVWAGKTFDPGGYGLATALRTRFPGRVFTAFGLLSGACLFWAAERLLGYHTPREKLLQWLTATGRGVMPNLDQIDAVFPIEGKRVVEFGPLEGAMTAGLLHLGAAEVCAVEIRMTNLLKLLSAAHSFGWRRLRVVVEDMHMVDASTIGRFDLVVAHGVYYHSADPFCFLRNIASLV